MSPAGLLVGTSGFAYREWIPAFYAPGTRTKDLLAAYAERLPAVELNNTYYRMPTATAAAAWRAQVPADFRFAVKAPMAVTVRKADVDPAPILAGLARALAPLGPTLGCLLLQFPGHVRRDDARLLRVLAATPREWPCACEFEDASWRAPAVDELLVRHGATRVVRDDADGAADGPDAAFGWQYVRLRRGDYDDAALAAWWHRAAPAAPRGGFVFFRHEDTASGPRLAGRLLEFARMRATTRARATPPR